MTVFAICAAFLTALTVTLLVVPLARRRAAPGGPTQAEASLEVLREDLAELERDLASGTVAPGDYEAAKRDLKRRILEDSLPDKAPAERKGIASPVALAVIVPLAAASLYVAIGNPAALEPQGAADQHPDAAQIEAMVAKLAARLRSAPDDPEGWTMLARSYRVLGRHADAAAAFARAEKRVASDPKLLTDWAESRALAEDRGLAGEPEQLLARALAIDPDFAPALALSGAAAFEREDWKGAIALWERLAKQYPAGTEEGDAVARSLAAARERIGQPAIAAAAARVSGRVSLARSVAAKAAPTDTVFVFARAAGGSPMPLAVLRKQVKDLPAEFSLDDSMALAAGAKLSGASEVIVGARVSRAGNATPQSGDLQGLSRPVKVGATGVAVVIDTALP